MSEIGCWTSADLIMPKVHPSPRNQRRPIGFHFSLVKFTLLCVHFSRQTGRIGQITPLRLAESDKSSHSTVKSDRWKLTRRLSSCGDQLAWSSQCHVRCIVVETIEFPDITQAQTLTAVLERHWWRLVHVERQPDLWTLRLLGTRGYSYPPVIVFAPRACGSWCLHTQQML